VGIFEERGCRGQRSTLRERKADSFFRFRETIVELPSGQTRWDAYRRGLEAIQLQRGRLSIESFTPDVRNWQEQFVSGNLWLQVQGGFASEGLEFLKKWAE